MSLPFGADSLTRWIRRARWRAARATPASDREFHDALFTAQAYDPFTASYPGYVTIRRFADLAAERLGDARTIADVGCGPGEITCELARRLPGLRFIGYDHSASAIARAREHAARLELGNASFGVADAGSLAVTHDVDAIVMFDAFHHLADPAEFIARQPHISRWILIEPAGDALGRWRWDVELDWLPAELDKVRQRFEATVFSVSTGSQPAGVPVPSPDDMAMERRYALADLEQLFGDFAVSVQGTVAGLMAYPPHPYQRSPARDAFGEFAYELFRRADAQLRAVDRDLGARHWCVLALRGAPVPARRVPWADAEPSPSGPVAHERVLAQHDVEYLACEGPSRLAPGAEGRYRLRIANRGWQTWRSEGESPILVSYHWTDGHGRTLVADGARTPLPRPLAPGEIAEVYVRVVAPGERGRAVLQLDLVHEGVTWFSEAGHPPLEHECVIR